MRKIQINIPIPKLIEADTATLVYMLASDSLDAETLSNIKSILLSRSI